MSAPAGVATADPESPVGTSSGASTGLLPFRPKDCTSISNCHIDGCNKETFVNVHTIDTQFQLRIKLIVLHRLRSHKNNSFESFYRVSMHNNSLIV